MKHVWIRIDSFEDRKNVVYALASSGYNVRTYYETDGLLIHKYWVIFEVPNEDIKNSMPTVTPTGSTQG